MNRLLYVIVLAGLVGCATPIRQRDIGKEKPKDPGGVAIFLSGIPDDAITRLHFDFGDFDVPMYSEGQGVFRGDLTAAQLKGFPHQPKGFRVYRAEVRMMDAEGQVKTKSISVDLRG